jgi:hypothetical protein
MLLVAVVYVCSQCMSFTCFGSAARPEQLGLQRTPAIRHMCGVAFCSAGVCDGARRTQQGFNTWSWCHGSLACKFSCQKKDRGVPLLALHATLLT